MVQENALLAEIVDGERLMLRINEEARNLATAGPRSVAGGKAIDSGVDASKPQRKPFQRASKRNPLGGRV
jgi:hypothetical protein